MFIRRAAKKPTDGGAAPVGWLFAIRPVTKLSNIVGSKLKCRERKVKSALRSLHFNRVALALCETLIFITQHAPASVWHPL